VDRSADYFTIRKSMRNSLSILLLLLACWSGWAGARPMPNGKVLLDGFSIEAKKRLFARVDVTNLAWCGYGERDSKGDRLCFPVEAREAGQRRDYLVVVTVEGVHKKPWIYFNPKMTDNEELAVWEERNATNSIWHLRNGQLLPKGSYPKSVSGEWIALNDPDRRPWLAKLDSPTVVAAELPKSNFEIEIFSREQTVHVFARRGWRNAEGPMNYLVYDFNDDSKPIIEKSLSWVRTVYDMDPEAGVAVVTDNSRFWQRVWLVDLKTGKRKSISVDWPSLFVKKEVAQKWIELTKP
jgi:hypothetical protein